MEKKEISIPEGCKKIQISIEKGVMTVLYESNISQKVFECPETGETEERPGIGDFCIFWNRNFRSRAFCANFETMEGRCYKSSDGYRYEEAIKFRNYEQFLKVRGTYVEEN